MHNTDCKSMPLHAVAVQHVFSLRCVQHTKTACRSGEMLYLRGLSIKPTVLQVLAPVVFQRPAFIQCALPTIIPLFLGSLHALAMYAERCGAVELFACKARHCCLHRGIHELQNMLAD